MTGENVAKSNIFSNWFLSLQQEQLVWKSWNALAKNRLNHWNLMLKLLMKTKSYLILEYLCKELSDSRKEDSAVWKELFDSIPKNWWIREASNLINYLYDLPWKPVTRLTDTKIGILVKKSCHKKPILCIVDLHSYVSPSETLLCCGLHMMFWQKNLQRIFVFDNIEKQLKVREIILWRRLLKWFDRICFWHTLF